MDRRTLIVLTVICFIAYAGSLYKLKEANVISQRWENVGFLGGIIMCYIILIPKRK